MLSRLGLKDAPVVKPEPLCSFGGQIGGLVARVVIGEYNFDPTLIRKPGDPFKGWDDPVLLVVGRDHDSHRRPTTLMPIPRWSSQRYLPVAGDQKGEHHEPDHQTGDIGKEDRDHPRHHRPDRIR